MAKIDLIHNRLVPGPKPELTENLDALIELFAHGEFEKAERLARRVLVAQPAHGIGWKVLGSALGAMGRSTEAVPVLERAISLLPLDADLRSNLGNTLRDLGRLPEAEASYRQALRLRPAFPEALGNLANALLGLGRLEEAEACCRSALILKPDSFLAHNSLGVVLSRLGRLPEAEASLRRALDLSPSFRPAYRNLAATLKAGGRLAEAETSIRRLLELDSGDHEARCDLGTVLLGLGRLVEAEAEFRKSLQISPDYHVAHNDLGNTLRLRGRLSEAESAYRRALALMPDWHTVLVNLGAAMLDLGRLPEAEDCLRRAFQVEPGSMIAFSNLLFLLNYDPVRAAEEIFAEYRRFDAAFGIPLRLHWSPHKNRRQADKRLRVGYVSPDFRRHSARHFIEPLLKHHDSTAVELFAYAELAADDEVTGRLKPLFQHWIPTFGVDDARLAERIRDDGIDVVVDLAGHTAGNRLLVFARKPAPVSVSTLGYGYTTGLSAIDWYLTDEVAAPAGSDSLFAERPWRLTQCPAFRPADGMGEVTALPALGQGRVTFGTLTRALRINHRTVSAWAEILRRVPGSSLRFDSISVADKSVRESILGEFAAHGIAADRLQIGFHSPPWDALREMDVTLDCFPHNSGTTLYESLYMGVPVITLAGRPPLGRLGASIVTSLGHPEWIAASEQEYVEKAVALATDLPRLAGLRANLRAEMQASPLMDEAGYTRKVEAALREMWHQWCASSRDKR